MQFLTVLGLNWQSTSSHCSRFRWGRCMDACSPVFAQVPEDRSCLIKTLCEHSLKRWGPLEGFKYLMKRLLCVARSPHRAPVDLLECVSWWHLAWKNSPTLNTVGGKVQGSADCCEWCNLSSGSEEIGTLPRLWSFRMPHFSFFLQLRGMGDVTATCCAICCRKSWRKKASRWKWRLSNQRISQCFGEHLNIFGARTFCRCE